MTDKEKAIVMAHTGICMLTGDKLQIFYKYVEDIMDRPIMTHEIGCLADEIKEKSKADFMALCANENNVEEEQEPILEKINKMKSEIADSLEFWDYSPNNNPLARDMLETITNFWGDMKGEEE